MEVIETMGSVGVTATSKCDYCHKSGHNEETCFAKQRALGTGGGQVRKNDGCAICGSLDHWKNECPNRGTDKDRKKRGNAHSARGGRGVRGGGQHGGGGGQHGGKGDGNLHGDVASNTLRPLECPRCKYSSKLTSCAGCKKTSNISHCLLHCPGFNLMSFG